MSKALVLLLIIRLPGTQGLKCFACYGIRHPMVCDHVITCNGTEVCGIQKFVDPSGEITYNLGCAEPHACGQKRSGPNPTKLCSECCQSELCNNQGCGQGHSFNTNYTLCYDCKGLFNGEECKRVTTCDGSEVCSIEEEHRFGEIFYTSECRDKHLCPAFIDSNPVIGKRQSRDLYRHCCDSSLCNVQPTDMKGTSTPTSSTLYTAPVSTSPSTTTVPVDSCADTRSDCKEAANNSDICLHISNSTDFGCRKTCGACEIMGTQFYYTTQVNIHDKIQLFFASVKDGTCDISYIDGSNENIGHVNIMNRFGMIEMSHFKSKRTFVIQCNTRTKIYAVNARSVAENGADANFLLPVNTFSNEYILPFYKSASGMFYGVFGSKGGPIKVLKFPSNTTQTYQNKVNQYTNGITVNGWYVSATMPISALVSGSDYSFQSSAIFTDMAIPIRDYGTSFVIPVMPWKRNSVVRVYTNNTCTLTVYDNNARVTIVKNFTRFTEFEAHESSVGSLSTSEPSMVEYFVAENRSATMFPVIATSRYLSFYHLAVPKDNSVLIITIPDGQQNSLRIDGNVVNLSLIRSTNTPSLTSKGFSTYSLTVRMGYHEAETTSGVSFGLWVVVNEYMVYSAGYRVSN